MADLGRPSEYDPAYAQQAAKLCELGATDKELADFFEVDTRTIYRWRNQHDDFCQAVIAGKGKADARVERALYNRAVGYTFDSEKVFQFQGAIVRAETVEHVPPDPGAAMNWLKNRQPDTWRDKQDVDLSGGIVVEILKRVYTDGHGKSSDADSQNRQITTEPSDISVQLRDGKRTGDE